MNLNSYTCTCCARPRAAIDWDTHLKLQAELRDEICALKAALATPAPSASTEALPLDAVAKDFVNFYAAVEMAYRHVNQKSDGTPFGDGYEMVPELGDTLRAFRSTKDCIIRASLEKGGVE